MKIQLNEQATKYFNEKVTDFLFELKPDSLKRQEQIKVETSASHEFVSGNIPESEIIHISSVGYVDNLTGEDIARYFSADNMPIGLDQKAYYEFINFAKSFQRKKEINKYLSLKFVIDSVFEWFENRYKGVLPADNYLVGFLCQKAEEAIKTRKISIPISFLGIEVPFKIGNIKFDYFRTDFIDKYINNYREKIEESGNYNSINFEIFERNFRKKYQGTVHAAIDIEAEKERGIEIATLETEKSLMVLRFFSPSTFLAKLPCYFGIMGKTDLPKKHVFIFENEYPTVKEGIEERRMHRWLIDKQELNRLREAGIAIASDLIAKEDPTEFEKLILNSVFLFSRCLTSNHYQDKIVFALVSIETLLLQNQSEPIQNSVGMRLAFLTKLIPQERKQVKELINKAYGIRSSFIHHGKIEDDWDLLQNLQHLIWTGLMNAMRVKDKFKSQKDFLDYIETLILK